MGYLSQIINQNFCTYDSIRFSQYIISKMSPNIQNYPLVDYFENSASSVLKKDAQKQLDSPQKVICVQRPIKKRQNRQSTIKGCEKASFQLAIDKRNKLSNQYNQNGQEVPIFVDISHFKKYGPGIFLFFHFTRYLCIFFILAGIISLCPIIYNMVQGNNLSSIPQTSGVYLAKSCLANIGDGAAGISSQLSLSASRVYKMVNNIPDIVISFGFLIFYIFWEIKSDKLTDEVKQEVKFMSFYAIEVKFAKENNFTEEQIANYFSKFGKVKEVAPVKDYQELIFNCKQVYSLQIDKKELIIQNENEQDLQEKKMLKAEIQKLKEKIDEIEKSMLKQIKQKEQIFKYYVVFETIKQRKNALKALKKVNSCCSKKNDNVTNLIEMKGRQMSVTGCHNEPSDIIWENQHITWHSRIWRNILQFILVVVLLWVTFSVISFLNIATPSTSTKLDVSSYTATTIQTETNGTILYVWCILHKDLMQNNSSIDSLCSNYINKYYLSIFIGILISIIIIVVKSILKKIVICLSKVQRYHQFTEQSIDMIKKLFFTYLCTTILITLLLQANILGMSIKRIIKELINNQYLLENASLVSQYSDFDPFWYVDIGYKLFLTLFILAIQVPLIGPIAQFVIQKIKIWKAKNALIQKQAQDLLILNEFEIEDHYANILLIIFVAMTFSAGMPIMYLCCSIAFALRYFYFRFIFLRYSKLPKSFDEALNESVINFLPFALIIHYSFGIWMYGTESIFVAESSIFDSWVNDQSVVWQSLGFILRRFGNSSYYTICFFITLGVILIKIVAYDLIFQNIKDIQQQDKVPTIALQNNHEAKGQNKMTAQRSITTSYRIQNNQNYFEVLAIFEKLKKMQVNVSQ